MFLLFLSDYTDYNIINFSIYFRIVEFGDKRGLEYAMKNLDNTELDGKRIKLVPQGGGFGDRDRGGDRERRGSGGGSGSRRRSASRSRSRSRSKSRSRSPAERKSRSRSR